MNDSLKRELAAVVADVAPEQPSTWRNQQGHDPLRNFEGLLETIVTIRGSEETKALARPYY
jgi:hypothetical protein